jgi:hypothetical protein
MDAVYVLHGWQLVIEFQLQLKFQLIEQLVVVQQFEFLELKWRVFRRRRGWHA